MPSQLAVTLVHSISWALPNEKTVLSAICTQSLVVTAIKELRN